MNRHERDHVASDDPREALLSTLLHAQSAFVARRRQRRRAVLVGSVALLTVSIALLLQVLLRAPLESTSEDGPMIVRDSQIDPGGGEASAESAVVLNRIVIERVGGGERQWIVLPPSDPTIVERLTITAARLEAPPIEVATASVRRATPHVEDDALLDHLAAAGRRDGLLRIHGRVHLVTHEGDSGTP